MKKSLSIVLSAVMLLLAARIPVSALDNNAGKQTETISYTYSAGDAKTYTREMEKLSRGLVAIRMNNGVYLSWRLLDSEDAVFGSANENVSFNIYRDDKKIDTVTTTTNYTDNTVGSSYSVAPVINGIEKEKCANVSVMDNSYFDIPLIKPEAETTYDNNGNLVRENAAFSPSDCSAGDVDGDGEYEIIVKWVSSEHDVGNPGNYPNSYSGTVRFSAYKLDGTKLWDNDINLGKNVYSSAHTVQFLVYDFDLDGKAEMICQTSLGSKDSKGKYVSHSADPTNNPNIYNITDTENEEADFRNSGWGLITSGQEFLTVFDGQTGTAIDTIDLPTARGNALDWGDANNTAGNRVNRFIADVAYLDGIKPYAVYQRGYYFGKNNNGRQRVSIAGISFNGQRLSADYRFDTKKGEPGYYEGSEKYVGQGNHNCTVADVDNDGKDEFINGALCMEVNDNNEFKPKWCTFMEHGDALHIGDYDPTHKGFEFFTVHEDIGPNTLSGTTVSINYGMSVIDADTGEIIFHNTADGDTGRGMMANVGAGGYFQINSSNAGSYIANGNTDFSKASLSNSNNYLDFRIFWDGDLYDELSNGSSIYSWNGNSFSRIFSASGCTSINGTKANPAIQADLFGDWREELICPTYDGNYLRVFSTTIPTEYKMKTLMHDPVYRSGVAAEQTAYNQPPHIGFYIDNETLRGGITNIQLTPPSKKEYNIGENLDLTDCTVMAEYANGSTEVIDINDCDISGHNPYKDGRQTITVSYMQKSDSFEVNVVSGFECDKSGNITAYYGNNESIIIPEYVNGILITAVKADVFTNVSSLKDIYIYNDISIEGLFPDGIIIHCFEGSKAHEYALTYNIPYEPISNTKIYADVTFDEEEYSEYNSNNAIASMTNINTIYPLTFTPSIRIDNKTGTTSPAMDFYKLDNNNNAYLDIVARRFSSSGRHGYITFNEIPDLSIIDEYQLSLDFSIQENTKEVSISLNDELSQPITSISSNTENINFDTWYHYILEYKHGQYKQIIIDGSSNVISNKILAYTNHNPVKTISFPVQKTENNNAHIYLDNISITAPLISTLTINVKDSEETPVSNADIILSAQSSDNNITAVTNENGQAIVTVPIGCYPLNVSAAHIGHFTQDNFTVYSANQIKDVTLDGTIPSQKYKILSVNENSITVNTPENENIIIYAAKYNNGILEKIEKFIPSQQYINTFDNLTFAPDKVFMWTTDMQCKDIWTSN